MGVFLFLLGFFSYHDCSYSKTDVCQEIERQFHKDKRSWLNVFTTTKIHIYAIQLDVNPSVSYLHVLSPSHRAALSSTSATQLLQTSSSN